MRSVFVGHQLSPSLPSLVFHPCSTGQPILPLISALRGAVDAMLARRGTSTDFAPPQALLALPRKYEFTLPKGDGCKIVQTFRQGSHILLLSHPINYAYHLASVVSWSHLIIVMVPSPAQAKRFSTYFIYERYGLPSSVP